MKNIFYTVILVITILNIVMSYLLDNMGEVLAWATSAAWLIVILGQSNEIKKLKE